MSDADAAYYERNQLVALLARIYPSGIRRTELPNWNPCWQNCVYIDLPTGQASWHYHDREAGLFEALPPYTKPWDGHTTEMKYERLRRLWAPTKEDAYAGDPAGYAGDRPSRRSG